MTRQVTVNLAACALLLAQYLLGIVVNLYVALPTRMDLQGTDFDGLEPSCPRPSCPPGKASAVSGISEQVISSPATEKSMVAGVDIR